MKKTKRTSRARHNQKEERFAKKVICQFVICIVLCVIVLINSKLNNQFSVQINNGIKHYLCVSIDFDEAMSIARVYFENLMNNRQSVPVNSGNTVNSEDEKQ